MVPTPCEVNAPPLEVAVIGDSRDELIERLAAMATVTHFAEIQAAIDAASPTRGFPEVALLIESRPSQFSAAELAKLRIAAPLAATVVVAGSWCDGESRSAEVLVGVERLRWSGIEAWFATQSARRRAGGGSAWNQPATVNDEDRILNVVDEPPLGRALGLNLEVGVVSPSPEMAQVLIEACHGFGHRATRLDDAGDIGNWPFEAIVWDMAWVDDESIERLCALANAGRGKRVLALAGFVREGDRRKLLEAGVAAVLAKPVAINELRWWLAELAAKR